MPTLDWSVDRRGGVTLVELSVTSDTDTHVRIESTLEPVWPPRTQGVPVSGWDGASYEAEIAATEQLSVGYATPADPTEPPAELTVVDDCESGQRLPVREVVRSLGTAAPPADVVGTDVDHRSTTENERSGDQQTVPAGERTGRETAAAETQGEDTMAWLDTVGERIRTAERLTGVETVADAREAVEAHGGIDEIHRLQDQLEADSDRLDTVLQRTEEYRGRLDSLDVPLSTLERIA